MSLINKVIKPLLFALLIITLKPSVFGQASIRDSAISMIVPAFSYNVYLPGGDYADRFGLTHKVGLSVTYKIKNYFLLTASYGFIFGFDVHEKNVLDKIMTSSDYLINGMGTLENITFEERGFDVFLKAGKLLPLFGPNPNSGILVNVGGGLLQHKIFFKTQKGNLPMLRGDYIKGYDRLSNGFALTEDISYNHFSNQNFLNFSIGFNLIQAFTKNRRDWNFDTMEKDDKSRLDLLYGLDIKIMLPLYKKAPESFYYN